MGEKNRPSNTGVIDGGSAARRKEKKERRERERSLYRKVLRVQRMLALVCLRYGAIGHQVLAWAEARNFSSAILPPVS